MKEKSFPWVDNNYDNEILHENVRKRPAMYFGFTPLCGLHMAILTLIHYCIENHKKEISLTVSGADIAISHEGEPLASTFDTDIVKAVCDRYVYRDNQYHVRFDKEIFENVIPNRDALFDSLRELAFLNKDLHITLNGHVFHYENGLIDLYQYLQVKSGHYWESKNSPIGFHAEDGDLTVDVAFSSNVFSLDPCIFSYVNNHKTEDNGVHVDGFIKGLKFALNKYKQFSCEHMSTLRDIDVGLIIHIKTLKPEYDGATKRKLSNPEIYQFVRKATIENLEAIFIDNPKIASGFVKCWRCT